MSRSTPYLSKPPVNWLESYRLLSETTLFLVVRHGPSVFGIKDEKDEVFKITLGNPHFCTCNKKEEFCIHILFCLLKVLKVPKDHPLCFQSSLTDTEMNLVLNGLSIENRPRVVKKYTKKQSKEEFPEEDSPNNVKRQILSDDVEETCPICQDEMKTDQLLSWCRKSCGNNVHAKCMLKYSQYKISNRLDPTCPYCREEWDMERLKKECRGKSKTSEKNLVIYCSNCKCLQRNSFFRCIECSQLSYKITKKATDFCEECFKRVNNSHMTHHFLSSDIAKDNSENIEWIACVNPIKKNTTPQQILDIQNREIDINDYDLLLSLDNISAPNIVVHLLESLPTNFSIPNISPSKMKNQLCWCGESDNTPLKKLPCCHLVHENCLREEIEIIMNEDSSLISDYRCCHENCGKRIFYGLSRKKKTPKQTETKINKTPAEEKSNLVDLAIRKNQEIVGENSLIHGLTGNKIFQNLVPSQTNFKIRSNSKKENVTEANTTMNRNRNIAFQNNLEKNSEVNGLPPLESSYTIMSSSLRIDNRGLIPQESTELSANESTNFRTSTAYSSQSESDIASERIDPLLFSISLPRQIKSSHNINKSRSKLPKLTKNISHLKPLGVNAQQGGSHHSLNVRGIRNLNEFDTPLSNCNFDGSIYSSYSNSKQRPVQKLAQNDLIEGISSNRTLRSKNLGSNKETVIPNEPLNLLITSSSSMLPQNGRNNLNPNVRKKLIRLPKSFQESQASLRRRQVLTNQKNNINEENISLEVDIRSLSSLQI